MDHPLSGVRRQPGQREATDCTLVESCNALGWARGGSTAERATRDEYWSIRALQDDYLDDS